MSRFARAAAGFAERLRVAGYHRALSQMSDRQLADIGLSRETISHRAHELAQSR
jgi:uncharacterized protein YjiS (DUF1127 family)